MPFLLAQQKILWTEHSKIKMRQYGLSENRIKRVLRFPKRVEEGIAPKTAAGMQPAGSKKRPYEIWVMWQQKFKSRKLKVKSLGSDTVIISVWKYPGISQRRQPPPIPDDVWEVVRREIRRH